MAILLMPEQWVQKHSDYLYGYAITRVYIKDDALDLVQETFYAALKARESFKGESSERTWLIAILKRKIIDYYRKKSSSKESELVENYARDTDYFTSTGIWEKHWKKERAPKEWAYTESAIEDNEFEAILKKCLALIPPKAEACFTLKIMDECSSEEICKELDITPSNLWTMMHRVKLQLRECIELNWFGKKKSEA